MNTSEKQTHSTSGSTFPTKFPDFEHAYGPVPYCLTNDYLFRAVLQQSNPALKGLICSLLHLSEEEVVSVEITNPIILGESIEGKEFRLDVNVNLNDNTFINLEMQLGNRLNWKNRSLVYLCRSFDQLSHGEDYIDIKPVIHIAFLDYSLFPENPEFCASYQLMNQKNNTLYSSNFTLNVIDLTHINLATEEDKKFRIDEWARLFKANTWEEVHMLAEKNEYLQEAAGTMFRLTAEEQIRKRCRDREEYYQDMRNYERYIAQQEGDLTIAKHALAKIEGELSDTRTRLSDAESELSDTKTKLSDTESELSDAKTKLSDAESELSDTQTKLSDAESELSDAKTKLSDAQFELSDTKTKLSDAESELSDTQTKLSDAESELSDAKAENLKLQKMASWAKEHGYVENF